MSKAFTKEDVDPPERPGRVRSTSGLPPGATNYITLGGKKRLQQELAKLRGSSNDPTGRIAEIEQILGSVTVVEPPEDPGRGVGFGARVTLRDKTEQLKTYRILGVDELELYSDGVSWISPVGRALLAAELNNRIATDETGTATIVKVEYPDE